MENQQDQAEQRKRLARLRRRAKSLDFNGIVKDGDGYRIVFGGTKWRADDLNDVEVKLDYLEASRIADDAPKALARLVELLDGGRLISYGTRHYVAGLPKELRALADGLEMRAVDVDLSDEALSKWMGGES